MPLSQDLTFRESVPFYTDLVTSRTLPAGTTLRVHNYRFSPYARATIVGTGEEGFLDRADVLSPRRHGTPAQRWCAWQASVANAAFYADLVDALHEVIFSGTIPLDSLFQAIDVANTVFPISVRESALALEMLRGAPLLVFRFYNGSPNGLMPPVAREGAQANWAKVRQALAPNTDRMLRAKALAAQEKQAKKTVVPPKRPSSPPLETFRSPFGGPSSGRGMPFTSFSLKAPIPIRPSSSNSNNNNALPDLRGAYTHSEFSSVGEDHVRGHKEKSPFISTTVSLPHLACTVDNNVKNILYGPLAVSAYVPLPNCQAPALGLFLVPGDRTQVIWAAGPAMTEREVVFSGMGLWDCLLKKFDNPFLMGGKYKAAVPNTKNLRIALKFVTY